MVLIMSVVPGEGGQSYIKETNQKLDELNKYLKESNLDLDIEVDGGINDKTAVEAILHRSYYISFWFLYNWSRES